MFATNVSRITKTLNLYEYEEIRFYLVSVKVLSGKYYEEVQL